MIICLSLVQVVCDDCRETVILKNWRDAKELGWAVPIDGAFQRCPGCSKKQHDRLFQEAQLAAIIKKCPVLDIGCTKPSPPANA